MAAPAGAFRGAGASVLTPLAPLELSLVRETCSLVGRPIEIAAIDQELSAAASGRLVGLTVEGEPGIGKTRLVLAAAEMAESRGVAHIGVTADEELRGPFLIARSIFASEGARAAAAGTEAEEALERALDAVTGRDDPALEGLPPDAKLLRTFDLAALALRSLAMRSPVALLLDDLQWADADSLRMLRYLVRTDARSPIFLMFALRPSEAALVNEAVTLLADMDRMGMVRRLALRRFTQVESSDFVRQVLGTDVNPSSAATMHAQSEGVPFILEEQARTYRDTGLLQQIDGVWTLARNAERLVPSAVRTLIQRRANRLPDECRALLAEAGILGRSFSLRDLHALRARVGDEARDAAALAEGLAPAVTAGLLYPHPGGAAADYSFTHEQVREQAMSALATPRRRAMHAAVVDLLTADGDPPAASLPILARHAVAAEDAERAARYSIAAAQAALEARAPEEALRLVDLALPAASSPPDRVALLGARDRALEMARRPTERLEGLAELAALADALADPGLELDVMLRRAAALRVAEEEDRAAALARRVRELAAERGSRHAELAACLELAQALLRATLGESYSPTASEVDLDGAEEALERAAALAEDLGDERSFAAALRELGVVAVGRLRAWWVDFVLSGHGHELQARVAAGETADDIMPTLPVAPLYHKAVDLFQRALELFDHLGDRRGAMSSLIAMAYITWVPEMHLTMSARRIEEVRRLATRMRSFTRESERALADVQMLYGVQVFARAKADPVLALSRGEEAYRQAQLIGERSIEVAAAGGMALSHLEMGELREADRWLDRAAAAAQAAPTPLRARQLEIWRGMARRAAGDARGMREHLDRAVRLATDTGRPAARCEAIARLALEAARLGAESHDAELLALAERSATEAKNLMPLLPGHPPWGAQADAALALVHLTRAESERALEAGRAAMAAIQDAMHEDLELDILLPAARAVIEAGPEAERAQARAFLLVLLQILAQRSLDEDIRVRWFRGPLGRELASLAGPIQVRDAQAGSAAAAEDGPPLADEDVELLRLLTEGSTNREIAEALGVDEAVIVRRLAELFGRIGAASRAEATVFALRSV